MTISRNFYVDYNKKFPSVFRLIVFLGTLIIIKYGKKALKNFDNKNITKSGENICVTHLAATKVLYV